MKGTLISALAVLLSVTALPWQAATEPAPSAAAATRPAPALGVSRLAVAPAGGIAPEVLRQALDAVRCATRLGEIGQPHTLTVIDYSRPSVEPRLWVFELPGGALLFKELVAHGRNTGDNLAR